MSIKLRKINVSYSFQQMITTLCLMLERKLLKISVTSDTSFYIVFEKPPWGKSIKYVVVVVVRARRGPWLRVKSLSLQGRGRE